MERRFKILLKKFMQYSSGQINHLKSYIYGWNVTKNAIHNIVQIFAVSYKLNLSHFNYLGMSVCIGLLKIWVWNNITDKMKKNIQQWGTTWLNLARRVILLKEVLSALPSIIFAYSSSPSTSTKNYERF